MGNVHGATRAKGIQNRSLGLVLIITSTIIPGTLRRGNSHVELSLVVHANFSVAADIGVGDRRELRGGLARERILANEAGGRLDGALGVGEAEGGALEIGGRVAGGTKGGLEVSELLSTDVGEGALGGEAVTDEQGQDRGLVVGILLRPTLVI
jgi:hypothetical protein